MLIQAFLMKYDVFIYIYIYDEMKYDTFITHVYRVYIHEYTNLKTSVNFMKLSILHVCTGNQKTVFQSEIVLCKLFEIRTCAAISIEVWYNTNQLSMFMYLVFALIHHVKRNKCIYVMSIRLRIYIYNYTCCCNERKYMDKSV